MIDTENRSTWFFPLLLTAAFVLSRLLFYSMGVRFDASGLDWYWQYLDVELLKSDLLRSVYYQHSQPPGFNLFLGIVLKLFPNSFTLVFSILFKGLSLALYYFFFRILSLAGFKRWIAFAVATLFILMPGVVLYENWLFYTWPTAVILVFAAYQLLLFEKQRRTRNALLYLLAILTVCLTRSMFHLIYIIAALVPILWLAVPSRRIIGMAGGMAVLLVGGLFLKNLLLFGFFGSSSWVGMNLWKIVPIGGKAEQLADSPVARTEPFSPIYDYPESYQQVPPSFSDIPSLAAASRQNGKPNLNHVGYIAVSDEYKRKAVELITGDLPGYAYMTLKAWGVYFTPARSYPLLSQKNITALKGWIRLTIPADARLLVPAGLLLVAVGAAASIFKRTGIGLLIEFPLFYLFCAGTVFYIAILGNMLEHGENMRFRVQTDPILYLAALLAVRQILPARKTAERFSENSGEKV